MPVNQTRRRTVWVALIGATVIALFVAALMFSGEQDDFLAQRAERP